MREHLKIALAALIPFILVKVWPYGWWCRNGLRRFSRPVTGTGLALATELLLAIDFAACFAGLLLLDELVNPGGQWHQDATGHLSKPTPSIIEALAMMLPLHWIVWSISSWQIQGGRKGFSLHCAGEDFLWRRGGLALSLTTDLAVYAVMFLFVFLF